MFGICDGITGPYTTKFYKTLKGYVYKGLEEGQSVSTKLFKNTSPSFNKVKDEVKSKKSASIKSVKEKINLPHDEYTPQEREALLRILKGN